MSDKPDYKEFSDPRLVAIYNTICPLDGYEKFYLALAKKLSAKKIVDIGCGTGLLTTELAKQGHQMTGIEPSRLMLEVAKKSQFGEQIEWIEGDALSLPECNADLAIMTGHVAQFYLDDDYWLEALESIHKTLRPGGYLAFESRNPAVQPWMDKNSNIPTDWYSPDFRQKVVDPLEGPIEAWSELVRVKDSKVLTTIHYQFIKTGEELVSNNELIFRTREEITQSLKKVGFEIENVYGNWEWKIATEKSPEMIFVARK